MTRKNEKASSGSDAPLDAEDRAALDKVADAGNQSPPSASPTAEGGQPSSAVTQSSMLWAGHALSLCNQFFVSRFGDGGAIPGAILDPIKLDLAAAIDAYLPAIDAKPGVFAAVALGGHFFACLQAAKGNATPSESSDKAEAEKQRSSSSALSMNGAS